MGFVFDKPPFDEFIVFRGNAVQKKTLDRVAKIDGISRSKVIRLAVAEYLTRRALLDFTGDAVSKTQPHEVNDGR
jgi:hypothetical protein